MVLLVVSGGEGTFRTVLATLQKRRPVVVIADSGGAANDMHEYIAHGRMPTNSIPAGQPGHEQRKKAIRTGEETLQSIKELGGWSTDEQVHALPSPQSLARA
jgi:hypothetical protein